MKKMKNQSVRIHILLNQFAKQGNLKSFEIEDQAIVTNFLSIIEPYHIKSLITLFIKLIREVGQRYTIRE